MDAIEALLTRVSVRAFTDKPLTKEQIDTLLEVMVAAPSGGNRQPWRIMVVKNQQVKEELAIAAHEQDFIATAPVIFAVCRVPEESAARYRDRGRNLYSFQDTAAMTENLLVAAHAMGLGGCWIGAFRDNEVARILECPDDVYPVALIPVGYPARIKGKSKRRPMREVVRFIQ
jgi:nitroreductase